MPFTIAYTCLCGTWFVKLAKTLIAVSGTFLRIVIWNFQMFCSRLKRWNTGLKMRTCGIITISKHTLAYEYELLTCNVLKKNWLWTNIACHWIFVNNLEQYNSYELIFKSEMKYKIIDEPAGTVNKGIINYVTSNEILGEKRSQKFVVKLYPMRILDCRSRECKRKLLSVINLNSLWDKICFYY